MLRFWARVIHTTDIWLFSTTHLADVKYHSLEDFFFVIIYLLRWIVVGRMDAIANFEFAGNSMEIIDKLFYPRRWRCRWIMQAYASLIHWMDCHIENFDMHKRNTHCPSNAMGGITFQRIISLVLVTSSIHRRTSGLAVPGVGYRTVRVSGNDDVPPIPLAVIFAPDANHGYVIMPTLVSLNDAYMMCVPSAESQIAVGSLNISSVYVYIYMYMFGLVDWWVCLFCCIHAFGDHLVYRIFDEYSMQHWKSCQRMDRINELLSVNKLNITITWRGFYPYNI